MYPRSTNFLIFCFASSFISYLHPIGKSCLTTCPLYGVHSTSILITDDFRSIPDLKKNSGDVEIHLSIYLLVQLVLEKIISIAEAQDALNRISEGRTWESAAIYNLAKKYILYIQ